MANRNSPKPVGAPAGSVAQSPNIGHPVVPVDVIDAAVPALRRKIGGIRAPSAVGFIKASDFTSAVAEELAELSWGHAHGRNRVRIISPDGRVLLAVAKGNRGTGRDMARADGRQVVNVAHPKKWYSEYLQDVLPGIIDPPPVLWVLLHYRAEDGTIYIELSQPLAMSGGLVEKWGPRHFYGPYLPKKKPVDPTTPKAANVDVPLKRKPKQ